MITLFLCDLNVTCTVNVQHIMLFYQRDFTVLCMCCSVSGAFKELVEVLLWWSRLRCTAWFCPAGDAVVIQIEGLRGFW